MTCKGCLETCHTKGKCFQDDDFEKMKNAMLAADGIILASPNYVFSVSAHMKAFLDRCGSFDALSTSQRKICCCCGHCRRFRSNSC